MTAKKSARAVGPYMPVEYELADVSAFQALERGDADEFQQKRALKWLIERAAGTYEFQYYPTSERDTSFSLGRAFVGQQVVKLLRLNIQQLRKNNG
ncbi:MAG: hypothetical protein VW362_04510 [Candidatus Nanopelagicales bacterium]